MHTNTIVTPGGAPRCQPNLSGIAVAIAVLACSAIAAPATVRADDGEGPNTALSVNLPDTLNGKGSGSVRMPVLPGVVNGERVGLHGWDPRFRLGVGLAF